MSNSAGDLTALERPLIERRKDKEGQISRRSLLKNSAIALGAVAVSGLHQLEYMMTLHRGKDQYDLVMI